jgi:ankyrin repeat protein
MWISAKLDQSSHIDQCFNELITECRLAAPGARLSYSIRNKIERLTKEERKEIVSRVKEGCAPLFVACKKGNVEIVEYFIEQCGADVEQKGVYEVPDDRSIHYVTPLWCASVAGKLSVVKCLVKHGANVNSVSDTGSTPVRSACFMTHLDIVTYLVENGADLLKPNYNGGTCLINSVQSVPLCEFLLEHGADVNAQDIQFKTALHYAIQEHRFETTKLLLEHGADPMLKSRYGDDALQTACLKGATQIFDHLIKNLDYSRSRIAEAHELTGSTFLDEHYDLQAALQNWRTALSLRYSDPVLLKPKQVSLKSAYLNAIEFQTLDELENLSMDLDSMRIQSLIICERILGPLHKDMIFRLMFRGAAYADGLQYQRCVRIFISYNQILSLR